MKMIKKVDDLNKESITDVLRNYLKDDKLEVTEINGNQVLVGENDNFASDIKSWSVKVKLTDGTDKEVNFVVKTSSNSAFHRLISPIWRPFAKEIFWLEQAYPTLSKLCPEIEYLSPKCIYGYSSYQGSMFYPKNFIDKSPLIMIKMFTGKKETGIILLENLNYRIPRCIMLDKKKLLSFEQVQSVFETYARLHGSFLKWQNLPDKSNYNGIRDKDLKSLSLTTAKWMIKDNVECAKISIANLLKNHGKTDLLQRWEKYAKEELAKRAMDHQTTSTEMKTSNIVTLCHGDSWTNNLMFTEDGSQTVLIDFQLVALLHPARDLWYFMSVATDADFRKAHLGTLLRHYYNIFIRYLEGTPIKITFEKFEEEVYERRDILISFSVDTMTIVLQPDKLELSSWSSLKEISRKKMEIIGGQPKENDHEIITEIRRRMIDMIQEAADCGFL